MKRAKNLLLVAMIWLATATPVWALDISADDVWEFIQNAGIGGTIGAAMGFVTGISFGLFRTRKFKKEETSTQAGTGIEMGVLAIFAIMGIFLGFVIGAMINIIV